MLMMVLALVFGLAASRFRAVLGLILLGGMTTVGAAILTVLNRRTVMHGMRSLELMLLLGEAVYVTARYFDFWSTGRGKPHRGA